MLVKKKRKKYSYKESKEQSAFFDLLDLYPNMKKVREVSFAIQNARRTSWFMGKTLKREGVRSGVPDVFIGWPTPFYNGLFIEHKIKGGKVSKAQKERMGAFSARNYKCAVSYSALDSIEILQRYLKHDDLIRPRDGYYFELPKQRSAWPNNDIYIM